MRSMILCSMAAALAASAFAAGASAQTDRRVTQLADGVYEIQHRNVGDGRAGGNTTVIIGARQVLVVDAPMMPSDATEDIAQIRRWTNKPVAFLVNTHFHNDHNFANRVYVDSFPQLTVIAHEETKKDMDRFGPGSAGREARGAAVYQQMMDRGTNQGHPLTDADRAELREIIARNSQALTELNRIQFQSATLTFDHRLQLDLGNRLVDVMFLGRGNTNGDAVIYLPAEHVAAIGDLAPSPLPYFYDGYPSEWVETLDRVSALDVTTFVPGHGPVLHGKTYVRLVRDLIASAVDQVNAALVPLGPAMFHTVDEVKGRVDLSPYKSRFSGNDAELSAAFDREAARLVALVVREASLR